MGDSPAPLYARVKQMITQQIDSGNWPPHYRVPSESELVSQLGFSRMTINRALREPVCAVVVNVENDLESGCLRCIHGITHSLQLCGVERLA